MLMHTTPDNDALDYDQPLAGREAEEQAAYDDALAEYQAARDASAAAPRDWQSLDRYDRAATALGVFWDRRRYGAINDRIVAEILAERTNR